LEQGKSVLLPYSMLEVSNSSDDSRQRYDHDLARIIRETVAPDREDGRPTRSATACAACRATAGSRTRTVLELYIAGWICSERYEGIPAQGRLSSGSTPSRRGLRPGG